MDVIRGERRNIRLDKSRTLQELVLAGAYGYVDPDIEKSFDVRPENGCVDVELEFVGFEPGTSTQSALRALAKEELHAGGLLEILSLGSQHHDLQRSWPIVALNAQKSFSTVYDDWSSNNFDITRNVVCLSEDRDRGRTLAWYPYDGPWHKQRFLVLGPGPAA